MTPMKRTAIVGVFEARHKAQQAVAELTRSGFGEKHIGVLAQDHEPASAAGALSGEGSHAAEGAVTGAAVGAGVGALWALGIAAGGLPVIGPVIAGGVLASVLTSAAGGAVLAGVVGALVGLGIPEDDARYYEDELKSGRTLVTVGADGREDAAWAILCRHGAYNRVSAPLVIG